MGVIHTELLIWIILGVGGGGDIRGAERRIIRKSKHREKKNIFAL